MKLESANQILHGREAWFGAPDASASLQFAFDPNHLYIAGVIRDDQIQQDDAARPVDRSDRIEIYFGFAAAEPDSFRPEDVRVQLMPLQPNRPWSWTEPVTGTGRPSGGSLAGVRVEARRLDDVSYQFEAAIPFHHFAAIQPGCAAIGCNVLLHDHDERDGGRAAVLSWNGKDPAAAKGLGTLRLPEPGPLVSTSGGAPLLSDALVADLPFLLVPLATVAALVLLLRGWVRVRARAQWLRPTLLACGVVLFAVGFWLPSMRMEARASDQRVHLDSVLDTLRQTIGQLERGTLAVYRGRSRDRALIDLLEGKAIARQRYTTYTFLSQLAPDAFGPPPREFDGLPIRPYWLPLSQQRAETFQFDPPLRGSELYLVVGRSFAPSSAFRLHLTDPPQLRLELDFGAGDTRTLRVEVGRFAASSSLGREFTEASVVPIQLDGDLRAISVAAEQGSDLRLVGLSIQGARQDQIDPLFLGAPSLGGVLTDLRGACPPDAGIELAPGATAKVALPPDAPSFQKLWFFYRAIYPGIPTANPGARTAEVLVHFRGGQPPRTIVLEHQVSMFYELAVHNTRDEPPEGSPAQIALSWIDDSQEKHVNLVYPVLDLPAGAPIEAIEFRNLADYRMRFRSVVFGNEAEVAPQDPVDAPLVRRGQERSLAADVLDRLRGASVLVYRGGQLSEATVPAEQRQELASLPRAVRGAGESASEVVRADGSRRATVFAPLGDRWDGAVLAVSTVDDSWSAAGQSNRLLGFVLCLLATPLLLVLLSELLAAATNLRFRLMAVLSVASLAPLGVLSVVLAQVLEQGHATDVEAGLRATVQSAVRQLEDQKERLRASVRQWSHDLVALAAAKLDKLPEAQFAKAVPGLRAELANLMAGQLPPEWHGGFLRLEWQPRLGAHALDPEVAVAGDPRLANVETPARLEPSVFAQWGALMLGVRAEASGTGGTFSLSAGRPLDADLLGALAPGQIVLLTDARGYPFAAGGPRAEAEALLAQACDPRVMAQRDLTVAEEPRLAHERAAGRAFGHVFGSEVLRDLQGTPRALLMVAQPDQRATLELPIGRIPVRAFFLLIAGLLVVLSAFLSYVVSARISRPIERLEHGALALSRGAFDTRLPVEEGGQIGRLTRTFNQMAADLQGRLQDLQALNRAMRELSVQFDEAAALEVLRRFCAGHTPASAVRVAFAEAEGAGVELHSGNAPMRADAPPLLALLPRAAGAFSVVPRGGALPAPWSELMPACRSVVAVPLAFGGRVRGAVLLGFEVTAPLTVDLDLIGAVTSQAAATIEKAQLHRLAVQDPVTGLFTPDYFRRRAVDEVSVAQQRDRPLAMVAVALGDGQRRPRGLRRFAAILREHLPAEAVLSHAGAGQFQAVLPGSGRAEAEAWLERVFRAWDELVQQLPENDVEAKRPIGVVVQFPVEAPSTEFLFDALRERLAAVGTPGASAMESDESLQRAGVIVVSPAMREVYRTLRRVAPTDLTILLEGETGVGKEVLTNLVHNWSRRAGGPLVKVHCAALAETLLASELFGHEKGAFTGADRRKIGKFEQADGGTLFLDEVGEIPADVQVKLLRVLQEREVDRVGGKEPVRVDVRVIAATNRDMARLVREGRFREDLYYRLQGMVVHVPPLRERKQELGGLVEHFRREVVAAGQSQVRAFSTDAMDELYRRDWPGNIRELRNTVFRAMVLATGDVVHARDIVSALAGAGGAPMAAALAGSGPAVVGAIGPGSGGPAESAAATVAVDRNAAPAPARGEADGAPADGQPPVERDLLAPVGVASPPPRDPPGPSDAILVPAERTFVLPSRPPAPPEPTPTEPPVPIPARPVDVAALPERLRLLYSQILARGTMGTQDHMALANVSHRTSLRDFQALLECGLIERLGSRRGTRYRPSRLT